MYKISHEVINFIEKTMKIWRVEQTAGERSLAEVKIQGGIFQGDVLWTLLFIIATMPHNHILRYCNAVYKLSRSQEKINHLTIHNSHDAGHITTWRNRTTISGQNENSRRKWNLQILGYLGGWHHHTSGNEKKIQKEYLKRTRKPLETILSSRNLINYLLHSPVMWLVDSTLSPWLSY